MMKKMKNLIRLVGISLALLLLFTASACLKTSAEEMFDVSKDHIEQKEQNSTTEKIDKPYEGYTLSLEGLDLIFRYDNLIMVRDRATSMATARSSPFVSCSYLIGDEESMEAFLSKVLVRDRVQLTPTTWEELGGERPGTPLTDYHYVSIGSESELYFYFRASNWQLVVKNEKTGDIYASEPGVVDSEMYDKFTVDYDWTFYN